MKLIQLYEGFEDDQRDVARQRFAEYESGDLVVRDCELLNLRGCPEHITGIFNAEGNHLEDLEGAPKRVDSSAFFSENKLDTLEGVPEVGLGLFFRDNWLTSLKGLKQKIFKGTSTISFSGNPLVDFDAEIDHVHLLHLNYTHIQQLQDIHRKIKKAHTIRIDAKGSYQMQSHVLGLLKIEGLEKIYAKAPGPRRANAPWVDIINRHLPNAEGNAALYKCHEELVEAGLEEFAKV